MYVFLKSLTMILLFCVQNYVRNNYIKCCLECTRSDLRALKNPNFLGEHAPRLPYIAWVGYKEPAMESQPPATGKTSSYATESYSYSNH